MSGFFSSRGKHLAGKKSTTSRASSRVGRTLRLERLEPRHLLAAVAVNAGQVIRTLNDQFLGVNLATWDSALNTSQTQQMAEAAGLQIFRIPGGSYADEIHFNTPPSYPGQGTVASLASFIASVGGNAIVTLDYGSGSPQEAAAELAYLDGSVSNTTPIGMGPEWNSSTGTWVQVNWQTAGYWASLRAATPLAQDDGLNFLRIGQAAPFGFQFFEVGNEIYGDWETDFHGEGAGSGAPHDPGTYVAFAQQFSVYAQQIAPAISIGLDVDTPWSSWTANVLKDSAADKFVPGFLSDHNYAQSPGSESDSKLLLDTVSDAASPLSWADRSTAYEADLQKYFGSAGANVELLATEFNSVSTDPGKQSVSLVEGLYVADSIGSMLETGYDGALFWDLRNAYQTGGNTSSSLYGWRQEGDYGMLGTGTGPAPATGNYVAYPQYYAEQLLSEMVHPGDTVVQATSSDPNLAVYAVQESATGDLDLLVINKSSSSTLTGTFNVTGFQPAASANVWQYGEAQDTAQSQTINGASALANFTATLSLNGASFSYAFPQYSMTVLDIAAGPPPPPPPPPPPTQVVSLTGVYNRLGTTANGQKFSGGVDGGGDALSATLLGKQATWNNTVFAIGPTGANDVVSAAGQTISLPAGSYSTLDLLATAVNGNQTNQMFVVHYTDGTSQSFTQNLSDWYSPQHYTGESVALTMAYRNKSGGTADNRTFDLYGYAFTLNSSKTVLSISLPTDSNVEIVAMTEVGAAASPGSTGGNQTPTVSPPTNLLATFQAVSGAAGTANTVQLTWTAPAGTITGYNIYRGTASGGESATPLNSSPLSATATTYQDTSVTAGGTYYYVVQAIDGAATSPNSTEAFASVPAARTAPQSSPTEINLSAAFNRIGISANGAKISGGLDGGGNTLSATLVGKTVTSDGVSFAIGPTSGNNVVSARGQTISLTAGSFSTLDLLGMAVNGNQTNQTIIHYTDGTTQSVTQNLSDWYTPQHYAGESVALSMAYRNTSSGGADRRTFNVYTYSLPLNNSKTVSSITLPNDANVEILAMTAMP